MSEDNLNALIVTRRPAKEMADGTLRVQLDVEPNDRKQFLEMFPDNGDPICVAKLDPESIRRHQNQTAFAETPTEKKKGKGEHGKFAQWLVKHGFFRNPALWQVVGTDAEFIEWLKQQPCCIGRRECAGDVVAAHVRRVATGAGTGIKPVYSAVPMCDHHHQKQHTEGESAIGGKDFIDKKRIIFLESWSRLTMKTKLGIESMTQLSPQHLELFLRDTGINVNIPTEFF